MSKNKKILLAVDIGGTKVATAVVTLDGQILIENQALTCQSGPQDGIQQIIALLENLLREDEFAIEDVLAIGIGIPAVLEPVTDFVIWGPNLFGWRNVDLRGALESHFDVPVAVEYDGHTAVLGEWWCGAGKKYQSIVDIIIGTGVGGGMVLDGRLFRGKTRLAGAAGWFGLTMGSDLQTDENRSLGFWESRIAGPAVAKRAKEAAQQHSDSRLADLNAEGILSAKTLFQAAEEGDPIAVQFCNELASEIGMGIANIVSLIDPQVVILGGGMGSNCGILLPRIREVVNNWAQPLAAQSVQVVLSTAGPRAGLLGAAYGALLRTAEKGTRKEDLKE